MNKAVVVADSGEIKTVCRTYEVKAYTFFNAVGLEVELYVLFCPCVIAGKNAVARCEEKSVALGISRIYKDAASPVAGLSVYPVIAVCIKGK